MLLCNLQIFYKPNQLISLDKTNLNRVQVEGMNILLKKAQDKIFYNTLVSEGKIINDSYNILTEFDFINYTFTISVEDLLDSISLNLRSKDIVKLIKMLAELSSMQIHSLSKDKISFINIFQKIHLDKPRSIIEFSLNKIYNDEMKELKKITKEINKRKGTRKRK